MFKPTNDFNLPPEAEGSGKNPSPTQAFELNEFINKSRSQRRGFKFDSEHARNFEEGNVQKARQGVKEIFADSIQKIKAEAERIREDAKKEGHDQGYAEGFKVGEEAARKEFDPFMKTLDNLIRQMTEFREKMYPKVEREMIEMIVGITKKILEVELHKKEDHVQDIIRLAVQSVLDRENMVIKVHPTDEKHAENYRPKLMKRFQDMRNISIEGQESVPRGHCVVETNFGTIHAGIENLHEQIEKILHLAPPLEENDPPAPEPS